ncbi:MAG TPA: hypothetical protein DET40_11265 [Lentisphaeria bacterium]|nr:MAG: hypothetical protein A2X45_19925 [Lentisphaerae bacterium GWF2_50_93]HCE44118.1 hypothetical protein [Lentisphaeria bacterium]
MEEWRGIVSHTHMLRSKESPFENTKENLVAWCRKYNVSAAGIGSPWEPVSAGHYGHYERVERDLYCSGKMNPKSVMDKKEIKKLFDDLNRMSDGKTLFYQDNENPKGRFGHLWYFGYKYDFPAWHDYSQDRPISYYEEDPCREINSITGRPHTRRAYLEVVATQRKAGAVAVWAHPTSWWSDGKGGFVTNIASEAVLHLLADGFLEGMVVQGYDAFHRNYQQLWFYLLDFGAIVPGFAETDACFDQARLIDYDHVYMNYMRIDGKLSNKKIVSAVKKNCHFASSGAFLTLEVDDVSMGGILNSRTGDRVVSRVEAYPVLGQKKISRLDLIGRGGKILATVENFTGGILEFELKVGNLPDYVIARTLGENDRIDAASQKDIRHAALTNPVYIQDSGFEFKPVMTQCKFSFSTGSRWHGGRIIFETADGTFLDDNRIKSGDLKISLPASARLRLVKTGSEEKIFYIAMANGKVHEHLRYLHNGEFLKDYPGLRPGEVPAEAFRLPEVKEAISTFSKSF